MTTIRTDLVIVTIVGVNKQSVWTKVTIIKSIEKINNQFPGNTVAVNPEYLSCHPSVTMFVCHHV